MGVKSKNYGHNPKTYVLRNWSKLIKQNPKGTKLATEPFWIPLWQRTTSAKDWQSERERDFEQLSLKWANNDRGERRYLCAKFFIAWHEWNQKIPRCDRCRSESDGRIRRALPQVTMPHQYTYYVHIDRLERAKDTIQLGNQLFQKEKLSNGGKIHW